MSSQERVPIPIEVYLRSSYEPDAEYVDGEIEERPAGLYDHSTWQAAVLFWFDDYAKQWDLNALPSLRVQVAPTRIRVPDVAILDPNQPREQIPTHAPLAVFEILSPEDTTKRIMRKLGDYAAMGIPQIWVIDPETKTYFRFVNGELHKESAFSLPEKGIQFDLSAIESLLD